MTIQEDFRADIEAFLERHQMKPAAFGSHALKDPKFVFDLRRGRSPSLKTIDRVRRWMEDYDAAYPAASASAAVPEAVTPAEDDEPPGEAGPEPEDPEQNESDPHQAGEGEPTAPENSDLGDTAPPGGDTPPPPPSGGTAESPPPPPPPEKPRRRWRLRFLLFLVVVAVAIGAAYYLRPDLMRRYADTGLAWLAARLSPETGASGSVAASGMADLNDRVERLQETNERLTSRIRSLENRLEKLSAAGADDAAAVPPAVMARLDKMENRLASLDTGDGDTGNGTRVRALDKEVESLRAALSEAEGRLKTLGRVRAETDNLRAMVKSVQGRLSDLSGLPDDIAALRSEIAEMQTALAETDGLPRKVRDIEARIAKLGQAVESAGEIGALATRVAEIEKSMADIRALEAEMSGASLTTAFLRLDAAVRTGDPYTASLALFRRSAETAGPGAPPRPALDRLARHADSGVSTQSALERRFTDLIPAVLRTTAETDTWWERLETRLRSLVIVRKQGDVAGADPAAVVARAETALQAGDLDRAVSELDALPPARRKIVEPWIADVRARYAVLSALAEIAEWIPEKEKQG